MEAGPQVGRLIMVAGLTYDWRVDEQSCTRHEAVLTDLLRTASDGGAFFGRTELPAVDAGVGTDGPLLRRHLTTSRDGERVDWTAEPGDLVADLYAECLRRRRDTRAFRMSTLSHRVFLTDGGLHATLPPVDAAPTDPPSTSVLIGFRFDDILGDTVCHVAASAWSSVPWSENHRPPRIGPPPLEVFDKIDVDWYADHFHDTVTPGIQKLFEEREMRQLLPPVFKRPYRPPVFWLAVPVHKDLKPDAVKYADQLYAPTRRTIATATLAVDDDRDCVVSGAQLNGEVLVLRRLVPTRRRELVPTYLLLPAQVGPPQLAELAAQEDAIRHLVTTLTGLETTAAAVLFDREKDLAIWENHLEVYQRVAERGGQLWDRLATHLLYHSGRSLDRAHRLVQLLHQTMLQGMADVEILATEVAGCVARLDEMRDDLIARFDDKVTETHVSGHDVHREGIRRALTVTGPFERLQRRATDVQEVATRVQGAYQLLLASVSSAFDERRVREGERLEKAGAVLAVVVALVGVVTVLDATLDGWKFVILQVIPTNDVFPWLRVLARLFSGLVALVLVGFPTWMLWRYVLAPRSLGTRAYRKRYREVWDLLRRTTTGRLDLYRADNDPRGRPITPADAGTAEGARGVEHKRELQAREEWRRLDADLSRRFADTWDRVASMADPPRIEQVDVEAAARAAGDTPISSRAIRRDIAHVEMALEKWSLQTLLLTERPRRLFPYGLPRLTALYHACGRLDETEIDPSGATGGRLTAVDEWDFHLVFQRPGLDYDARRCEELRGHLLERSDLDAERKRGKATLLLLDERKIGVPVAGDVQPAEAAASGTT